MLLTDSLLRSYVSEFNAHDPEPYRNLIPNTGAADFLAGNIPLFECPDPVIERTYFFRWWTYRKHIVRTPEGYIVTEFLPSVPWAGKYNTITLASCLHQMEGRWLRNRDILSDYLHILMRGGCSIGPNAYLFTPAFASFKALEVWGKSELPQSLLADFIQHFAMWQTGVEQKLSSNGLFYLTDGKCGTEYSIAGPGFSPFTNAALFGEASAIAEIARQAKQLETSAKFEAIAAQLKAHSHALLWDCTGQFFRTMRPDNTLADVRELAGYMPWHYGMATPEHAGAWAQLLDADGFLAPYGLTYAEQRHPAFRINYAHPHECLWDGPSWPLATSMTLTALAHHLTTDAPGISRNAFFEVFHGYARSHQRRLEGEIVVPWIDENLNPYTGEWIARSLLQRREREGCHRPSQKGPADRGADYNHSTFCDLVITGLVGLRPSSTDTLTIDPLLPAAAWDWFCLDKVTYHDRVLTIFWDRTGTRYGHGAGLHVLCDGRLLAHSARLEKVEASL